MADLVLRGGLVVNHDGVVRADVVITGGTIEAVVTPDQAPADGPVVDVSGRWLFPGVVDPHAHITNRRPFADSYDRETPSMLLGGTTTLIDFLATEESYVDLGREAIAAVEGHAWVDLALHAVIQNALHIDEMEAMAREVGITSAKMYMGGSDWRLYPTTLGIHDGLVHRTLAAAERLGLQAMVHAENQEIAAGLQEELQAAGRNDAAAWTEARPNLCEVDCLHRVAGLVDATGSSVYAVHLTTHEAPGILRQARHDGVAILGETCPHYLTIHANDPRAQIAKYLPSIKYEEDREALWAALMDGTLHCVGSDHIPVRLADKQAGADSIWTARGGVPGSGTILPVLISEGIVARGLLPEQVAAVSSYNAARIFGLPTKGRIAPGADADIVVVDLERTVTVRPALLGLDFTLFDGLEFTGWPETVIKGGRVAVRDATLQGTASGRYIHRTTR